MVLSPDPLEPQRLIGDDTSEFVTLLITDTTNFPLGVLLLGGDDTIDGSLGNDLVYGNQGEDVFYAWLGDDFLFGGKGKDVLDGELGNDSLMGNQDADFLLGSEGNDILRGGKGNDFLISGNGNDTLVGDLGRDALISINDDGLFKIGGSTLFVLKEEPGVIDINNADLIAGFRVGADQIGLAGGLTVSDVDLQFVNVTLSIALDLPEFIRQTTPPELLNISGPSQGTLIKLRNSDQIIGFVESVEVADVQNSLISVQGF